MLLSLRPDLLVAIFITCEHDMYNKEALIEIYFMFFRQNRDLFDLFNGSKSLSIFQPDGSGTSIDNPDKTTQNQMFFAVILEFD